MKENRRTIGFCIGRDTRKDTGQISYLTLKKI